MMLRELKVRVKSRSFVISYDEKDPKTGLVKILPVDCFSYSKGLVNSCGFNANDVYAYEHAASDSVADAILHRINTQVAQDVNKDVPLEEKLANLVPRNWCSPAEYGRYIERVTTRYYYQQQNLKAAEEQKIDFSGDKPENV